MKKSSLTMVIAAVAATAIAAPLSAQTRSTVDAVTLDAAVIDRADKSRTVVTTALTSPRALDVASSMGLTKEGLATRIASLDDAEAKQVAEGILAGGDSTIVISTTALIIGLLLILVLTR